MKAMRVALTLVLGASGCASEALDDEVEDENKVQTQAAVEGATCGSSEEAPCCTSGKLCANDFQQCIDGICIERAPLDTLPIITLDMEIKTCNDAGWFHLGAYDQTYFKVGARTSFAPNAQPAWFYINAPRDLFRPNMTDRVGLRLPGVRTLGDIKSFDFSVFNGDLCLEYINLYANGLPVGGRNWNLEAGQQPHYMRGTYPYADDYVTIPREQFLHVQRFQDKARYCAAPDGIPGDAFRRAIVGAMGNALVTTHNSSVLNAGFAASDWLTTRKVDDSTIHVDTRFHSLVQVGVQAHVMVRIAFDLKISCAPTPATEEMPTPVGNSISLEISPVEVVDVDGDVAVDILTSLFLDNGDLARRINSQLEPFKGALQGIVKDLLICPMLTVDGGNPPGIGIAYPDLSVFGLGNLRPASICL